jgi:hypothetical protein
MCASDDWCATSITRPLPIPIRRRCGKDTVNIPVLSNDTDADGVLCPLFRSPKALRAPSLNQCGWHRALSCASLLDWDGLALLHHQRRSGRASDKHRFGASRGGSGAHSSVLPVVLESRRCERGDGDGYAQHRSNPALTVHLSSANTSKARVPASVVIPPAKRR